MDQNQLKTSWKTRIVIGVIAFLMMFSTMAVYALIVLSGEKEKKTDNGNAEELAKMEKELTEKRAELETMTKELSSKYYEEMKSYRSNVRAFNAQSVNDNGLKTTDLKEGDGEEITSESSYHSYYIGWCADESVFDSSFDNFENPTTLVDPLSYGAGKSNFIAGWEEGVIGMKMNGVRLLEIPGELAYGDSQEICGGTNSPLKYVVKVIKTSDEYTKKSEEYNNLYQQYIVLYYAQNQNLLTTAE